MAIITDAETYLRFRIARMFRGDAERGRIYDDCHVREVTSPTGNKFIFDIQHTDMIEAADRLLPLLNDPNTRGSFLRSVFVSHNLPGSTDMSYNAPRMVQYERDDAELSLTRAAERRGASPNY